MASESVVYKCNAELNLNTQNTENFEAKYMYLIFLYVGMLWKDRDKKRWKLNLQWRTVVFEFPTSHYL